MDNNQEIRELCHLMAQKAQREILHSSDFEYLSQCIFDVQSEMVSVSTLKRLYGYVNTESTPRRSTLDVLCRYVGYDDWHSFIHRGDNDDAIESNPIYGHFLASRDLIVGETVIVTWQPGRRCRFRYLGNEMFVIEESVQSKLKPGMTFRCLHFISGEPLYLDDLTTISSETFTYVCGRNNGIEWNVVE